jgi:fatty acid-binding protein DegV
VRARLPAGRRAHVAVHHTQAEPEARALADRLRAACDPVELFVTEFTPVMGAYCGPGLLGAAFYAEAGEYGGEAGDDGGEADDDR